MTTPWDELVATAVVGTERRDVPAGPARAASTLLGVPDVSSFETGSPAHRVLALAGVLAAWRRAGWRAPPGGGDRVPPAPPHDRPEAPARATQLLELLLGGHLGVPGSTAGVVSEWLERCAATGRRPPDRLLPELLTTGTSAPDMRDAVSAAGGARLRWLAARNADWRWAAGEDGAPDREVWATGDCESRGALLRRLRATDPGRGRALLEETWATERAADRERFLNILSTNLGPEDEPFLEAALDDRARAVRAAAAELLAGLSSSRLARRMVERLRPLVRTGRRFHRRLEVQLPHDSDLDPAVARDGITDKGAPAKTGLRAWRLIQLVAAAPLEAWPELTGLPPEEIVTAAAHDPDLGRGWAAAAARQRNPEWARLLLRHRPDPALLTVLPPAVAHQELAGLLASVPEMAVPPLVEATPGPWPAGISYAVLRRLRATKSRVAVLASLPLLAARLDPSVGADVEDWIVELAGDKPLQREVRALAHALSIRAAIAQEFP